MWLLFFPECKFYAILGQYIIYSKVGSRERGKEGGRRNEGLLVDEDECEEGEGRRREGGKKGRRA